MSSGYIPAKDEPGPDEILEALREAIFDKPRLGEMPSEEVARQPILRRPPSGGTLASVGGGDAGRVGGQRVRLRGRRALRGGQPHLNERRPLE